MPVLHFWEPRFDDSILSFSIKAKVSEKTLWCLGEYCSQSCKIFSRQQIISPVRDMCYNNLVLMNSEFFKG